MRVNVDSIALKDPRFRRLAKVLGCSWYEALGRCVAVWMTGVDKRADSMSAEEIDIAAGLDGFADAMGRAGLVMPAQTGEVDLLRIRGLADRIQYLKQLSDKGRAGANARWNTDAERNGLSRRQHYESIAPAIPDAITNGKAKAKANALAEAMPSDLDLDLDPDQISERDSSGDLVTGGVRAAHVSLSVLPSAGSAEWEPEKDRTGYPGLLVTVRSRGVDPDFELEKFRRHARAHGWDFVDKHAAWEGWLLKARPSKPLPPSPAPTQARDKFPPASVKEISAEERAELSRMAAEAIAVVEGKIRTEPEPQNYEVYDGEDGYDE